MSSHNELSLVAPLAGMLREALPLSRTDGRSIDPVSMRARQLRSRAAHRWIARLFEGLRQLREQHRQQRQRKYIYRLYLSLNDHLLRDLGLERDQVVSMLIDDHSTGVSERSAS